MASNNENLINKRDILAAREKARAKQDDNQWLQNQHVDLAIVVVVSLMLASGLVMLFSASMSHSIAEIGSGTFYFLRQVLATVLGVIVMFVLSRFNIKVFDKPLFALIAYTVSLLLLTLTLLSDPINNARRWITIPGFGAFQPSELTKVVLVYTIAVYESWLAKQRAAHIITRAPGVKGALKDAWYDIGIPVLLLILPSVIMVMQPHFSGIIILALVAFTALLASGLSKRNWITGVIVGIILVAIALTALFFLEPVLPENISSKFAHVTTRLEIFSGSDAATEAELYQSKQALIAIGSGGLTGVGLGQGKQKTNYLPEVHNDYIFSSIVEETGFLGGLFVVVLFLIFFLLGMRIAYKASSAYGQIVAAGISTLITLQAFLNIAVNVGAIPPTGISLPFFSYGGTSNLFFLIGVGLILNVSKYGVRNR